MRKSLPFIAKFSYSLLFSHVFTKSDRVRSPSSRCVWICFSPSSFMFARYDIVRIGIKKEKIREEKFDEELAQWTFAWIFSFRQSFERSLKQKLISHPGRSIKATGCEVCSVRARNRHYHSPNPHKSRILYDDNVVDSILAGIGFQCFTLHFESNRYRYIYIYENRINVAFSIEIVFIYDVHSNNLRVYF